MEGKWCFLIKTREIFYVHLLDKRLVVSLFSKEKPFV